jgi:hypothetical protein
MTIRYKRTKRDTNHSDVAQFLTNHGIKVVDLAGVGGVPDLLIARAGYVAFLEVKTPKAATSHRQWTRQQIQWISESHHFNVMVAESGQEAVSKFRNRTFLTVKAKDALAAFLAFADEKQKIFEPNEIEPILTK